MQPSRQEAVRPGDIIEVRVLKGYAYLQYVGFHPEYLETVHVMLGIRETRPNDLRSLAGSPGYIAFYEASLSVSLGWTRVVDNWTLPDGVEIPSRIRREAATDKAGNMTSWVLENGAQSVTVEQLSADDARLPIGVSWNHEMLVKRISQGWRPEDSVTRASDSEAENYTTPANSRQDGCLSVTHYLYFPNETLAKKVVPILSRDGFAVEDRLGVDGANWLVLARHLETPDDTVDGATREKLQEIAMQNGGQYDGREFEPG